MGSGHEQGRRGTPSFVDQDVVGAACSRGVHDFEAASQLEQRAHDLWRGEALLRASSQNEDGFVECRQPLEINATECGKVCGGPVRHEAVGENEHIPGVTNGVDADITVTVSGKSVKAYRFLDLEFHKIAMPKAIK